MNSLNFNHYLSVSTIVKIWNRLFLNDSFNLFCSILKRQLKEDFKIYKLITISNVQNCFYHFQFQNIYYWVWKRKRLRNRAYYFNRFICGFIYIYIKYFHCCMKYIEKEPRTNKKWIYILKMNVFIKFFGVECIAAAIIKIDNLGGNFFFFWTITPFILIVNSQAKLEQNNSTNILWDFLYMKINTQLGMMKGQKWNYDIVDEFNRFMNILRKTMFVMHLYALYKI